MSAEATIPGVSASFLVLGASRGVDDVVSVQSASGTETVMPVENSRAKDLIDRLMPMAILAASRGSAIVAQFACQLVVGALAGATGVGILQLFTSWTCIAGEVLALGLPSRAMRQVSVAFESKERLIVEDVLIFGRRKIIKAWLWMIFLAAPIGVALTQLQAPGNWSQYHYLIIGTWVTAPLFALMRLYTESLKATGATLTAVTVESLTSPLVLLGVCAVCWLASLPLVATTLAVTFGVSLVIAPIVLRLALQKEIDDLPSVFQPYTKGVLPQMPSHVDLFHLWGAGVLSIIFVHLPFLLMPNYVDTAEIGVFSIAHKLINVITTLLLLLAAIHGPAFARCAAIHDKAGMLALLRKTQWVSGAVFIPTAIILLLLSGPLANLFGEEFGELDVFMLILVGGHLVNALTGLSGVLLNMAGAASRELLTLILGLGVAVAGSLWAGPRYGAVGLAIVFSASIAIKNIASYIMARELLHRGLDKE
ncbi:MAG: O-antigen/teichoic acid export membrane protein [Halioglobus sp.]|jgi:O-antigen/teichoic acid export membrane protein